MEEKRSKESCLIPNLSPKSSSIPDLSDELWCEIFTYLPVKSLLRFRSVSPSWLAIVDSPDFARLHLIRFSNYILQPNIRFNHLVFGRTRCEMSFNHPHKIMATLHMPPSDPQSLRNCVVASSIDGLFMLRTFQSAFAIDGDFASEWKSSQFILWNPSIRKSRKLPSPPEIIGGISLAEFGFGFDPLLKDYKYVRLGVNELGQVLLVQVYTVGTNSWRNIGVVGCSCFVNGIRSMRSFYLNGVLYTLASGHSKDGPVGLVSFDLSSEVFASTRLPIEDDTDRDSKCHIQALTIISGENSLLFVDSSGPGSGIVWGTENLGADFKSLIWTRRRTFFVLCPWDYAGGAMLGFDRFLYLKKTGEMLKTSPTLVNYQNPMWYSRNSLADSGISNWQCIESLLLS